MPLPFQPDRSQNDAPGILDEEYNMKHGRRGKAVVFSHKEFVVGKPRKAAEDDVERLRSYLPRLGFQPEDILVYEDLTFNEMKEVINELQNDGHEDSDCLMIFVLTHGNGEEEVSSKDMEYNKEEIWKPFLGNQCKGLLAKPKIFFFVACRGKLNDPGAVVLKKEEKTYITTDSRPIPSDKGSSYTLPIYADILIVNSTQRSYYSYRSVPGGTWYIQAFCQELQNLPAGVPFNFMDFLTRVNLRVCVSYPYRGKRQCPSITSQLVRRITITPTEL